MKHLSGLAEYQVEELEKFYLSFSHKKGGVSYWGILYGSERRGDNSYFKEVFPFRRGNYEFGRYLMQHIISNAKKIGADELRKNINSLLGK